MLKISKFVLHPIRSENRRNIMYTESKTHDTRFLVKLSMLITLIVIMTFTPLGHLPGVLAITIVHLPVIVGAILYGPKVGTILSLTMGLASLTKSIIAPTSPLNEFFRNPLISVLPRLMIGISAYFIYKAVLKLTRNQTLGIALGALFGSLANTVCTLGMLYIVYAKQITQLQGNIPAHQLILTIALSNGVLEIIATTLISIPLVLTLKQVFKIQST